MLETAAERRRDKRHIQSVYAGQRVGLHPKQEEVDAITFLTIVNVFKLHRMFASSIFHSLFSDCG